MGIILVAGPDISGVTLMSCSRTTGETFKRFSDLIASEFELDSVFLYDGQLIEDMYHVDTKKMTKLYRLVAKSAFPLFKGWAEWVAGMLEVESGKPWGHLWRNTQEEFLPRFMGVSRPRGN